MDSLDQLLNRCHRAELLPLARILQVREGGLGFGDLTRALAVTLRRIASHDIANAVLRRGHGRPYPQLLADTAAGYDVAVGEDDAATERGIVAAHFRKRWEATDVATRETLWRELGIDAPVPEDSGSALALASERLGRSFNYVLSRTVDVASEPGGIALFTLVNLSPVGCLLRPVFVILLPVFLWWKLRPDTNRVAAAVLEIARLRMAVVHRVTIGVVGSPSSGKDAGIKALFGLDSGNVSPIAGSTKEVAIQRAPGATALYLVNTPGMGDVIERVTEEARQVLDHIDIYVYVVNCEGGVQAREKADFERCRATGKPVLAVMNKVDVLRPRDKERYLADARSKLGVDEANFMAVAFDPLPQLAPGPIGLTAVHDWLRARLVELGKDPDELPDLPVVQAQAQDPNAPEAQKP